MRTAIVGAYREAEGDCLARLIPQAEMAAPVAASAGALARRLVEALRGKARRGGVEGLIQEYALSSQEGVALMCLAEALLRIPDAATRDAMIRDKIGTRDWQSHVGQSPSLFVNAATWGLVVTGKLAGTTNESGLAAALTRLIARGGEPVIRRGVDIAMRMMGEQFVTGQTIAAALSNSRRLEAEGFRYSYDMLGEAAMTAADAARYFRDYETAIHAIGRASNRRGIYEGPGISVKLSALHPRYGRAQRGRVMAELLPALVSLLVLARRYDIGLNIDAEEADRLDVSLDLLEAACAAPELAGWNGIGFVVQAYQKRAPFVLAHIIELARRTGRRLMVRLVKGAYWDSEIKRAQVDGLAGFPVFTRKLHTDVSYLACAKILLAAPDAVFPQFATHNAYTLAAIHSMAGENFYLGQYEFQCLHGMGEPLYEEVVGRDKLNRPCRIYAPVGTHETLLAYLVRRLLENGANSSFVNRINDPAIPVAALVADPVAEARASLPVGAPHPRIAMPREIFGPARANSLGFDLSDEAALARLSAAIDEDVLRVWRAAPMLALPTEPGVGEGVRNPADLADVVGEMVVSTPADLAAAFAGAQAAWPGWRDMPAPQRADCLRRVADAFEGGMLGLVALIIREAGKSAANAVAEVREAVDFLRYYALQCEGFSASTHVPLGVVVCISPWNFPLAIFTGQIAAALAVGNVVLAKPAEETPLIAAEAVRLLLEAGVPPGAVQLLPGRGDVGAALVADTRTCGVMFTGSTEVARSIQRALSGRLTGDRRPVPLIAETGGQNALIVDSSALPEQVVGDVLASAFDSAGQRCSALRVLCLQDEIAERVLTMLKGAMAELSVGDPRLLSTDVGPVISEAARDGIVRHVQAMRAAGRAVHSAELPAGCGDGIFVAPTLIEIAGIGDLDREVFGPVLHVVRYRRDRLDALIDDINATGYALTFGIHSRIDETIAHVTSRIAAGNIYVNRNQIGAVVGVQPFGGHGLSGTGPKAGGPLYLRRLLARHPAETGLVGTASGAGGDWREWLGQRGRAAPVAEVPHGVVMELAGPVGERNLYALEPRGRVLCVAADEAGLLRQIGTVLAAGCVAVLPADAPPSDILVELPASLRRSIVPADGGAVAAVLHDGPPDELLGLLGAMADREGPIVAVHGTVPGSERYAGEWLLRERSISTNTAAAGGNANLMSIG